MKHLSQIIACLLLTGCITSTYKHTSQGEEFKVTSLMKSVDGLRAEREDFIITVDKTDSQTQQINAMMELLMKMYLDGVPNE